MTPALNPCPFCGGKAKVNELRRGNYRRVGDNYQAVCNRCRARGPLVQDEQSAAVTGWNAAEPHRTSTENSVGTPEGVHPSQSRNQP